MSLLLQIAYILPCDAILDKKFSATLSGDDEFLGDLDGISIYVDGIVNW